MTILLDGNVLVALVVAEHIHHEAVSTWFASDERPFATTPSTQGTLLRFLLRSGLGARAGLDVLDGIIRHERHVFWADDAPYDGATLRGVVGHRQVTDAYLAARVRDHGGRLATLDRGLVAVHAKLAELVPTDVVAEGSAEPGPDAR